MRVLQPVELFQVFGQVGNVEGQGAKFRRLSGQPDQRPAPLGGGQQCLQEGGGKARTLRFEPCHRLPPTSQRKDAIKARAGREGQSIDKMLQTPESGIMHAN